jgi:hypothetical protein
MWKGGGAVILRSVYVPAQEASEFEQNLVENGYVHCSKIDPKQLTTREFIKEGSQQKSDKYGPVGYTFIWIE